MFLINKEKTNFSEPSDPFIIVRKLTKEIIEEAVKAYAKDDVYWLKLHHFSGLIQSDIFNKLQEDQDKADDAFSLKRIL